MQTINKGGDVLARGNVRCTYPPAGGSTDQKKWDEMWKNEDGSEFDPEAYRKAETKPVEGTTGEKEVVTTGIARTT